MPVSKGDIIDEAKRYEASCRLVATVLDGGAGFQQINCCGNELTDADRVAAANSVERYGGEIVRRGFIIDESKNHPNSCGLKVEILDGGAGFVSIVCCGNELTAEQDAVS